jgi:hypothetical protein
MAKPFKTAELGTETTQPQIASTVWVAKLLRRFLGKLDITSDDFDINSSVPGHLSLSLKRGLLTGGSSVHPFRVEYVTHPTTGVPALKLWPGVVVEYSSNLLGSIYVPNAAGTALTVPVFLPLASKVYLQVGYNGSDGSPITPYSVIATNGSLPTTTLRRGYGDISPRNANLGLLIATVSSNVVTQIVTGNIRLKAVVNSITADW